MARSLSDDPVKLRKEELGLSRRLRAVRNRLQELERIQEGEPDVATGEDLHRMVEQAKACIGATVEELAGGEVEADSWGAF